MGRQLVPLARWLLPELGHEEGPRGDHLVIVAKQVTHAEALGASMPRLHVPMEGFDHVLSQARKISCKAPIIGRINVEDVDIIIFQLALGKVPIDDSQFFFGRFANP
jgi:hypothetical protein